MEASRLGKLAPELRNRIWEYAVAQDEPIKLSVFVVPDRVRCKPQSPNITWVFKTCKQIHEECATMFYANNTFIVESDDFGTCSESSLTMLATQDGPKIQDLSLQGLAALSLPIDAPLDRHMYSQDLADEVQGLDSNKLLALAPNLRHLSWFAIICEGVTIKIDLRNYWDSLRTIVAAARERVANFRQAGKYELAQQLEGVLNALEAD
ncbi:hypothetical protein CBER1_02307 [Cercospora berteroae]|uniref:Uncharacterized protein n=1 Tax=Cercospora berteroae TaxID=357750 RepID=A0A2S6CM32_9PEZI|nr:hypothetical protein CBER1_02307 [Cercospora berteroae]